MSKLQIGLIGCFQNGKSTLVNCLLGNRVAVTGEGVAKTKKSARYVYGDEAGFYSISKNGKRKKIDKDEIYKIMLNDVSHDGTVCEMVLPSPLLKDVDIVDTPGFDAAQEDTSVTSDYIPQLDYIFFVIGRGSGGGGLNSAEKTVLSKIVQLNVPFSVVFNCRDINHWSPMDEHVKMCIDALTATFVSNGIRPYCVTSKNLILPVNLAWYWQALVLNGLDSRFCFFDKTEAEVTLLKAVKNHFYDDDSRQLPPVEELIRLSNIDWIKRFVMADTNPIVVLKDAIPAPVLHCELKDTSIHAFWNETNPTHIYEFSYRQKGERAWITIESNTNELVIPQLENGLTYECRVRTRANNKVSVSKHSEEISISIPKIKTTVTYRSGSGKAGIMDDLI
ncbi:MAG: dynamin family protein [Planctomycetia bacterium]|nr:dynamin family protein [Planctomycetia bacterium]